MTTMASQITSLPIVYSSVYSGADQREHQSSASLAFVRGIHRWPVNSPHKGSVTRKVFPFDDVIMILLAKQSYIMKVCIWLTHCALATPYGDKDLSQLLPQVMACRLKHQAITWINADLYSVRYFGLHLRTISQKMLTITILYTNLKITHLRLLSYLRVDKDLMPTNAYMSSMN